MIRVLHITNNDYDGAGLAAKRLNSSLNKLNIDSKLLVLYKKSNEKKIISLASGKTFKELSKFILSKYLFTNYHYYNELLKLFIFRLNNIFKNLIYRPQNLFNFEATAFDLTYFMPHMKNVDYLVLHSVQEIISIKMLNKIYEKFDLEIIFHPLDMEMITGGYHFSYDCNCYKSGICNSKKHNLKKLSKKIYQKKINYLSKLPIKWITTSKFMMKRVMISKIFSEVHSIDTVYMGIVDEKDNQEILNKETARHKLDLEQKNKIMLFGCFDFSDPRKGAHLLKEILSDISLQINNKPVTLITYGSLNKFNFENINLQWKHFGNISHEKLKLLYRASDFMLSPSIDDIGPTTVQEAFYYDLPVIGFDIGFVSDFIVNKINGEKIDCFDKNKFSQAILKYLDNEKYEYNYDNPIINDLKIQCKYEVEAKSFLNSIKKS